MSVSSNGVFLVISGCVEEKWWLNTVRNRGGAAGCPVPGRTGGRKGKRGDHKNSIPFVDRVLGKVWLM